MVVRHLKGERVDANRLESGFLRHVQACHSAVLPGERIPFRVGTRQVGWVRPRLADRLGQFPEIVRDGTGVTLPIPVALPELARTLAAEGCYRWRNEAFDVRADPNGPALTQIDRGAVPAFGILAVGVHVNGLVQRKDGLHVWVARRAPNKQLDPNKLDHIVAGGVPAGLSVQETLVKEAAEEAAIPAHLASQARLVATLGYAMERPEGLRRDHLYCYDLSLPETFKPRAADGEVAGFELWPIERVAEAVGTSDDFKFNVNLVLIDLFIRQGLVTDGAAKRLRGALSAGSA
jgi:8-oxo-dGTP pyrophosphatase MutT (NUDIX family)